MEPLINVVNHNVFECMELPSTGIMTSYANHLACPARLYPIFVRSEALGPRFAWPVRCVTGWQVSLQIIQWELEGDQTTFSLLFLLIALGSKMEAFIFVKYRDIYVEMYSPGCKVCYMFTCTFFERVTS